jgi:uncharacterized glyoxalase superfamily protein PhnB
MQKITPNLWFKGNAEEAVQFYLSVFPDGKIITTSYYPTEGLLDFQKPITISSEAQTEIKTRSAAMQTKTEPSSDVKVGDVRSVSSNSKG